MIWSNPIRQAVILMGGPDENAEKNDTVPSLRRIAQRPLLDYIIEALTTAGVEEITLASRWPAGMFQEVIDQGLCGQKWRDPTGRIPRIIESRSYGDIGSAGEVKLLQKHLDKSFYLIDGQSFFDCNLIDLAAQSAKMHKPHVLLAARRRTGTSRLNSLTLDKAGQVQALAKAKPRTSGLGYGGIAVFSTALLDQVEHLPCNLEAELFPRLIAQGLLFARVQEGTFWDTPQAKTSLLDANKFMPSLQKPAVFFARNGVLNIDCGYTHRLSDLALTTGAGEATTLARRAGYRIIVISNQSGIGRGMFTEGQLDAFNARLNQQLYRHGGWVDAFFHSPYHHEAIIPAFQHPDHPDRKPNPGMILRACARFDIDLKHSIFVGHQPCDSELADTLGIDYLRYRGGRLDQALSEQLTRCALFPLPPGRPSRAQKET